MGDICGATKRSYVCTLPAGHGGRHVGGNGLADLEWSDDVGSYTEHSTHRYHNPHGRLMASEDCAICNDLQAPAAPGDYVLTLLCTAREQSTGRNCDLDRGHLGPHVSITEGSTLAWAITRGTTDTLDQAVAFSQPEKP